MTEEPDNIVLVMLRQLEEKLDRVAVDIQAIRDILIRIERRAVRAEE